MTEPVLTTNFHGAFSGVISSSKARTAFTFWDMLSTWSAPSTTASKRTRAFCYPLPPGQPSTGAPRPLVPLQSLLSSVTASQDFHLGTLNLFFPTLKSVQFISMCLGHASEVFAILVPHISIAAPLTLGPDSSLNVHVKHVHRNPSSLTVASKPKQWERGQ
jgi:hypothetical protein